MKLSPGVEKLIPEYQLWQKDLDVKVDESAISVDEVAARVASFYEKIRGIVDWREEHLLRKTAIERILKRRVVVQKFTENFAEDFLLELVRGGHFPNKRISLEKIDEIQEVVEKYIFIIDHYGARAVGTKKEYESWLLSIAAVEIEEALSLPRRERALIEIMTSDLRERIVIAERKNVKLKLTDTEKDLQIYVAVQRALLKLDDSTITYHLIERFYPDWKKPNPATLTSVSESIETLYTNITNVLTHPFAERFYQVAEKYDTPYLLLGDIVSEGPDDFQELIENPIQLEDAIRRAYDRRHTRLKGQILRAAIYSTLSIFLTKILVVLAIEVPLEHFVGDSLNVIAIGISVTFPPVLMFILVMTAQTTSKQNVDRVIFEFMKILQVRTQPDTYKLFPPRKKSALVVSSISGLYIISFLFSFGILVWLLEKLNFPLFSIVVFTAFLSLVLFGGTKIRQRARELMIEPPSEGFLYNIYDIFSLPMIQVGKWLSGQFVRYNLFVLILNFLIEVPFQIFVEFIEQWRNFLKEKKEKIR